LAARLNQRHQEDIKGKIQASQLVNLLQDYALGKKKQINPGKIKAAEILLARSIPILSSVEQTITDDRDKLSEEAILSEMQAIFLAKPELLDKLIQLRDAARLVQEGSQVIDVAMEKQPA
jgi:hypothetical protein